MNTGLPRKTYLTPSPSPKGFARDWAAQEVMDEIVQQENEHLRQMLLQLEPYRRARAAPVRIWPASVSRESFSLLGGQLRSC